jgi:hypothetical protein
MATKKKTAVVAKGSPVSKTAKKEAVSTEIVIASIEEKAKGSFSKLKKIDRVESDADMATVGNNIKILKDLAKEADVQKSGITDPSYEAIKNIKESIKKTEALFKPFEDKVDQAEMDGKALIEDYLDRKAEKLKQLEQDFKDRKIKKVSTFTEKTNALQTTNTGAAKIRKITKMFITDPKKIPKKFFIVDEAAVEAALKNGEKVPGAELKKVNSIAI